MMLPVEAPPGEDEEKHHHGHAVGGDDADDEEDLVTSVLICDVTDVSADDVSRGGRGIHLGALDRVGEVVGLGESGPIGELLTLRNWLMSP